MEMKTVEFVRKIRDSYYYNLKDKSSKEQKIFYKHKAEIVNEKVKKIIQRKSEIINS